MRIFYTDHFELPLPEGHRFPMDKYRRLRQCVVRSDDHADDTLHVPPAATDKQLTLCHAADYVRAVADGRLTLAEIRRIGFPWSELMVERSRRSTGATISASRAALEDSIAVSLAGGTHHAFADAGEGYCVFNDAAVAIRTLQREGLISRACVIDLDVHQGNGTASIFAADPTVFTLSIHGVKNFPLRKVASDLDVSLGDGAGDQQYMAALHDALGRTAESGPFDLAVYLAGADPFHDDRLGRLSLSKDGLSLRDSTVMDWCRRHGISVAVTMAGGYAPRVEDIVDIHCQTVRLAAKYFKQGCRGV